MKKSLLSALALGIALTFATSSPAQEKKREGRQSPEERMKQLSEALKLTDEQKAKLGPILKEEGEKLRAIFGDANASREEKGKKMQEARKDIAAKVKAVLTPEQGEKYDKLVAGQASKRKKQ